MRHGQPTRERCAQIATLVAADFEQMRSAAEAEGSAGSDQFYATFRRDLRLEVRACGERWSGLMAALRAEPQHDAAALAQLLEELLQNNARWLNLAGQQFLHNVNDFS